MFTKIAIKYMSKKKKEYTSDLKQIKLSHVYTHQKVFKTSDFHKHF